MFIIWLSVVPLEAPNRPVVIMGENALELANQSMCYTHYKHEPDLNTSCYKK